MNKTDFFCPLCGSKRTIKTNLHLSFLNYIQMTILSFMSGYFLGSYFYFSFFLYWSIFEFLRRASYRQEMACGHCGFDAFSYQTDINLAKRKVEQFWQQSKKVKSPELESK